jgi:sigma-B regulation protein RsbU (phosphoserine phosphatase)
MAKTQGQGRIELPDSFIDVVYLSDKMEIPAEVRGLFRDKKLTFCRLPLARYGATRSRPDLVGAVVIDADDTTASENPELGRILESLERDNIGTIVLTQRVEQPVASSRLSSPGDTFSTDSASESVSLDDLWSQISMNLAYRKRLNPGIAVKPPAMANRSEKSRNSRLAGQSQTPDDLVDSLTEQLRLAGLVQRDFLPSHLPNSSDVRWAVTFLPAEWVSGDIYDVARIDEQHMGFYLADAVGHSMPAALLTIFIKQALAMRETVGNTYRIFAPAEVMKNLNLRMTGQKLSGYQFATCCYCLLNVKTRQLTVARAGHPYPILLRHGQPPQQIQTRGALLGIFENAEFLQQTVQLQAGDRILLYSDGAEFLIGNNDKGEVFQFSKELTGVKDAPIAEIVDRLTELAGRRQLDPAEIDDLTIMGLEIL